MYEAYCIKIKMKFFCIIIMDTEFVYKWFLDIIFTLSIVIFDHSIFFYVSIYNIYFTFTDILYTKNIYMMIH